MSDARRAHRRAVLFLWLVAVVATAAMWRHPTWLAGAYDWRYFQSAMEAGRRSLAWFAELPLYNPYMCGGEPQLANPQSVAGSPAFLLVAFFGTAIGEKLMLLLFVGLGLDGAFRLARQLGAGLPAALLGALVFGLSGWIVLHFGIGHVSFYGAALIPHALYFYLRGRDDLRFAIGLGATMAVIVAQGGTSTAAMAAIALGTVALVDAIAERALRPLVVLVLGAACALLLGAYRLLPALEFALDHPRRVTETDAQSPLELLRGAFAWTPLKGAHRYGGHEYGWRLAYAAWPLVLLGVVGAAALRRRALALFLVGAGIALGDFVPYGPWWLMRHAPVLRDLRVPSRYVLLCALGGALLVAGGADWLLARLRTPRGRAIAAGVLVALVAADGVAYADGYLWRVFDLPAPRIDRRAPFHQVKGHWSRMLDLVFQNQGVIGCDEEAPLTRALALDEGEGPQARLADPGAGSAVVRRWSPSELVVEVQVERPTRLLVNLNWNEHWHAAPSTLEVVRDGAKWPADKDGGRLAVVLPAMRGTVALRYRPRSFVLGAGLSLVTIAGLALALARRRRR